MADMKDLLGYDRSVFNSVPLASGGQSVEGRYAPVGMPGTPKLLGQIGDFLQSMLGFGTPYKDAVEKSKLAGALDGFTENPMEALDRVAKVNPNLALESYEKLSRGQAANEIRRDALQATINNRDALALERAGKSIGSLAATLARDKTGKAYKIGLPILKRNAEKAGFDLSDYGLPDEWNENAPTALTALASLGTTAGQVMTDENTDTALAAKKAIEALKAQIAEDKIDASNSRAAQRDATTRRGQDIRSNDSKASQTTRRDTAKMRDATTRRGQDIRAKGNLPPPRKAGDKIRGPNGEVLTSSDGKTWDN